MYRIIVIPDMQVKEGVVLDHLEWIGKYIVDQQPDEVVELGDFADVYSLNSYDKGKFQFEGARYKDDVESVRKALEKLWTPLYNSKHWNNCRTTHLNGNHEHRIDRYLELSPEFIGMMSIDDFGFEDWYDNVVPFLEVYETQGIYFSHYFYNHRTGRAWGGNIITRLKNIGHSFIMGHQQGFDIGNIPLGNGKTHWGAVVGSGYVHDEHYMGPQAQHHWRGILVLNECRDGIFDPCAVSLDYLCRKYQKMNLKDFLKKKYGRTDGYI